MFSCFFFDNIFINSVDNNLIISFNPTRKFFTFEKKILSI